MSDKLNQELPSLAPDRDQIEAYKKMRIKAGSNESTDPKNDLLNQPLPMQPRRSAWSIFFTLLIFSLGGGGGWWFYQQDLKTTALLTTSERRIHDLEQQLSLTGEEMGESAGALKVRLEKLTKQTEELWQQMDKLWASAWRRNQSEIIKLKQQSKINSNMLSKQSKQDSATVVSLKSISQKQTELEFRIAILVEQVQATETIKNSLTSLQSKSLSQDKQQIKVASSVSQLTIKHKELLQRIEQLETELTNTVLKKDSL